METFNEIFQMTSSDDDGYYRGLSSFGNLIQIYSYCFERGQKHDPASVLQPDYWQVPPESVEGKFWGTIELLPSILRIDGYGEEKLWLVQCWDRFSQKWRDLLERDGKVLRADAVLDTIETHHVDCQDWQSAFERARLWAHQQGYKSYFTTFEDHLVFLATSGATLPLEEAIFDRYHSHPEIGLIPFDVRIRQVAPEKFFVEKWDRENQQWVSGIKGRKHYAKDKHEAGKWARALANFPEMPPQKVRLYISYANSINDLIARLASAYPSKIVLFPELPQCRILLVWYDPCEQSLAALCQEETYHPMTHLLQGDSLSQLLTRCQIEH